MPIDLVMVNMSTAILYDEVWGIHEMFLNWFQLKFHAFLTRCIWTLEMIKFYLKFQSKLLRLKCIFLSHLEIHALPVNKKKLMRFDYQSIKCSGSMASYGKFNSINLYMNSLVGSANMSHMLIVHDSLSHAINFTFINICFHV